MLLVRILLIIVCFSLSFANSVTRILTRDRVLIRRKRYLTFPPGSNFAIQCASVKALLRVQPLNWNFVEEMDFPFALPSDTKWITTFKKGTRERRQIHRQLGAGLTRVGLNGTACVRRMICDVQNYFHFKGKSLLKDILLTIFKIDDGSPNGADMCDDSLRSECSTAIIDYIFGGFLEQPDSK